MDEKRATELVSFEGELTAEEKEYAKSLEDLALKVLEVIK